MSNARLLTEPSPGALGRVVELHAAYYAAEWGFGPVFEAKVAREMAEFLDRFDARTDAFLTVELDGRVEGSLVMDGLHGHETDGAHLRWFILGGRLRGQGFGRLLLDAGSAHCRACGFDRIHLWTFAGLDAARRLYDAAGFEVVESRTGDMWGTPVTEQRMVATLD